MHKQIDELFFVDFILARPIDSFVDLFQLAGR